MIYGTLDLGILIKSLIGFIMTLSTDFITFLVWMVLFNWMGGFETMVTRVFFPFPWLTSGLSIDIVLSPPPALGCGSGDSRFLRRLRLSY